MIAFLLVGCKKDSLVADSGEQANLLPTAEWGESIAPDVTLADIRVEVVDGMFSFATVADYQVAEHAVAKASDEDYLAWQQKTGLVTQFSRYNQLSLLAENSSSGITKGDLDAADFQFLKIDEEGRLALRYPSLMHARLLNAEGRVLINGDLNIYTDSYHMLIDEADPVKLEEGLANLTTDWQAGIVVEIFSSQDEGTDPYQKVQQANFRCPIINNNDGGAYSNRTDQQDLPDKQELRSTYFITTTTVTINNSTGQYTVLYEMFISFENWRREGLTWKRTQPRTRGTYQRDNIASTTSGGSTLDVIRVDRQQQVYVAGTGQVTVARTANANVSRHTVFANGGENFDPGNGATTVFDNEAV